MITSSSIDSLSSFIAAVSALSKGWRAYWVEKQAKDDGFATSWLPWFRGEDNADWLSSSALQPKLYRNNFDCKMILDHEQDMRVESRRRGAQLMIERPPTDKWEWYFLMQHYRAPTRLLDWSDAALVGLHFAVRQRGGQNDTHGSASAAIYMLDPWWLNEEAFKQVSPVATSYQSVGPALPDWEEAKPYLPDEFDNEMLGLTCPRAIDPSHFSRRIAAQRSHFTIFGRDKDGLKAKAIGSDSKLVRFEIGNDAIPEIKRDLRLSGVSEDSIFPDLEGLGRELCYFFEDNCR
jgi:hypothetical protein